ncbi:acyltransferase family protein [Deminuibacter soli]|uniref:Acyltransferase n=1 Tax=Deminuibacter soli TaxID=2291815 RepID=A0A3E1NGD0_9BACT|nr:acyltransferase [Deminuibacter soli]RFM27023.1 acyltransferase [Deminuibacter soli]
MSKQPQLPGIQYLRALAAILVVLTHTSGMARFPKYFNMNMCDGFFDLGAIGVPLFFVISGFIIAYVSLQQNTLTPKISPASFFGKRFTRIIPFMWVCVIGYAMLRVLGRDGKFPYMEYGRSIILFPVGAVQPNQIWTLRHEFLFYILFCISILQIRSYLVLVVWFLSPFVWFFAAPYISNEFLNALGSFVFSKLNLLFGGGYLVAVLFLQDKLPRLEKRASTWLTVVSIVFLLIAAYCFAGKYKTFYQVFVCGVLSSLVLYAAIYLQTSATPSRIEKLLLLLGDASYAIYLIHAGIVSAMLGVWSKLDPKANWVLIMLAGVLLSCTGGIIAHKFIEKPLLKLFQGKKKSRPVPLGELKSA